MPGGTKRRRLPPTVMNRRPVATGPAAPRPAALSSPSWPLTARHVLMLAGLTAGAGALRFATLRLQSFGDDELYTVWLVRMRLRDMLATIPESESTPPLYYLLAWVWAKLFGTGEVGLRSLSALLGTTTVPLAWLAARRLASPRTALVAAALAAVHPMLVWYSQEARSYALLIPLATLSFVLFLRARERPGPGELGSWAAVSALALDALLCRLSHRREGRLARRRYEARCGSCSVRGPSHYRASPPSARAPPACPG